jgi:hypothetical protein
VGYRHLAVTLGPSVGHQDVTPPRRLYLVPILHHLKVWGAALTMFAMAALVGGGPYRASRVLEQLVVIFVALGVAFAALGIIRLWQRVEISAAELRLRGPLGFALARRDVSRVLSRDDALGPYELIIETVAGERRKLSRIYAHWDELVADVTAR